MATPFLGLREIQEGDPVGHLTVNQTIAILEFFAVGAPITNDTLTAPPGSVGRSQAWILGGAGTSAWAGQAANTIAIALSDNPVSASGWFFFVPVAGTRVWILAGTLTGHRVWNGSAWAAV